MKTKFRGDKEKTLGYILSFYWSQVFPAVRGDPDVHFRRWAEYYFSWGRCQLPQQLQRLTSTAMSLPDKPAEGTDPRKKPPSPTAVSLGTKSFPKSLVQVNLNWQEPLNPTLLLNAAKPFRDTGRWHVPLSGLFLACSTLVGTSHVPAPDPSRQTSNHQRREEKSNHSLDPSGELAQALLSSWQHTVMKTFKSFRSQDF